MTTALATPQSPSSIIAEQNDLCRLALIDETVQRIIPCRVVKTSGIDQLTDEVQCAIFRAVGAFHPFSPDNDPYGEHDFGALEQDGYSVFWKIDYYDPTLQCGSEDPADLKKTMRVLTIMLAHEY